jgi:hypothetical protein
MRYDMTMLTSELSQGDGGPERSILGECKGLDSRNTVKLRVERDGRSFLSFTGILSDQTNGSVVALLPSRPAHR